MSDMLSQDEINALFSQGGEDEGVNLYTLSKEKKDVIGEVGNISLGTSATTLSKLLNQRVEISTPEVNILNINQVVQKHEVPCICVRVDYKEGLKGANCLVLNQRDVKIITDLMMGGSGEVDEESPIGDLHLSAISEAMNQMIGSSATSIASMLKTKVDIDTPVSFLLESDEDNLVEKMDIIDEEVVCTSFRMIVGDLIDSEIMQIVSIDFANEMVEKLSGIVKEIQPASQETINNKGQGLDSQPQNTFSGESQQQNNAYNTNHNMQNPQPNMYNQQPNMYNYKNNGFNQQMHQQANYQQNYDMNYQGSFQNHGNVNVQPVQFQNFNDQSIMQQKENIGIIRDVPLEVTVELGRTKKLIKEILEFNPGTIIELDKLSGEPIDILVNGKFVAKGEVVVIDENFGIRVTDIISVENRI